MLPFYMASHESMLECMEERRKQVEKVKYMVFAGRQGHYQFYYIPYDKLIVYIIIIKREPRKGDVLRIRSKGCGLASVNLLHCIGIRVRNYVVYIF